MKLYASCWGIVQIYSQIGPFQIYLQTGTLPDLFPIRPHSNFIHKPAFFQILFINQLPSQLIQKQIPSNFIHKPAPFQIYLQPGPFPNLFTNQLLS